MLLAVADSHRVGVWQPVSKDVGALRRAGECAVDDRFASLQLGEDVGADSKQPDAASRAVSGMRGAVPDGLVGRPRRHD